MGDASVRLGVVNRLFCTHSRPNAGRRKFGRSNGYLWRRWNPPNSRWPRG